MTDEERIQALSDGARRAAVIAMACKAVVTQQMAGRPFNIGVARDLVVDWVNVGSPEMSTRFVAEVMAELGSMIEAAESLEDTRGG